jgi:hypothetical protein
VIVNNAVKYHCRNASFELSDGCENRPLHPARDGIPTSSRFRAGQVIGSEQIAKSDRQCNCRQENINATGGKFGEWIDDDIATEMVPIYGRGTHDFRNALKKLSE